MERIDLNDISFFVTIIQAGSLSRAAEQLCLPKSRLSRRLTELETALGSKLTDRNRNGVRLNELGEAFYRHAVMMLDCADQAVGSVQQSLSEPRGLLRISVSTEILRGCLEPHLDTYLKRYPDVSMDISMDNRRINMIQDGIDIALRIGLPAQDDVVAKLLGHIPLGLYAAPEYLHGAPPPNEPEDLQHHILLHKSDGVEWLLQNENRSYRVQAKHRIRANDAYLLAKLAAQAQGIALLPRIGSLIPPQLTRVLPEWAPQPVPLYAVYYKNRGFAPIVRSFVEWLPESLSAAITGQHVS